MAEITLQIGDQRVAINCAPHEQRRLGDLAALLESRLAVFAGEPEAMRQIVLTALALMDEAQGAGAALARARAEIDRLNDLGCADVDDAPVRPMTHLPEGAA